MQQLKMILLFKFLFKISFKICITFKSTNAFKIYNLTD